MENMKAQNLFKEFIKTGSKIKLLGDSITHGVGGTGFMQSGEDIVEGFKRNPDGYCWAAKFKSYIKERYGKDAINNACTGTNIEFVLRNFDTLVDKDDDLVICTIGTNNRHQYKNTGDKRTADDLAAELYGNIVALNERFYSAGIPAILIANIPASAENEKDGADYWRILHMNDINDTYKRAAGECGFAFISLYDMMSTYLQQNGIEIDALLCDGLHPSDKGYDVMFSLILTALGEEK